VKCRRCKKPGAIIEVVHRGRVVASGALCDPCFDAAQLTYADHRQVFEALISVGVSRDAANAALIARIEGKTVLA
jgi:hypothetical protein